LQLKFYCEAQALHTKGFQNPDARNRLIFELKNCYRSRDLINWNDFGIVLPMVAENSGLDIQLGARLERPKSSI
jgi:hypothetical protein